MELRKVTVRQMPGVKEPFSVQPYSSHLNLLVGPNESGKTTLLNVSVGLDQPTEGKVWVGGQDLTGMSAPELAQLRLNNVGFIFQSYNLVPVLSAEENAELILLLRGVPAAERKRTVHQVLKEVGLEGLEHRRPSELSGG
ncbi:MAG: ATP-binding cassette domain-containing protein, partial [Acidobacteria bacterium]|nr:ATP-binding cassette domain-containing protein [Acidobacteriota bacterium]